MQCQLNTGNAFHEGCADTTAMLQHCAKREGVTQIDMYTCPVHTKSGLQQVALARGAPLMGRASASATSCA